MTTATATTTNDTTKTQQRAVCPACFAQQAITADGRLVPHGYKRPQDWHQNIGTCSGAGFHHYGTDAGRDYSASIAARLLTYADKTIADAADVEAGTGPVFGRKRVASGVYSTVVLDSPTPMQRSDYARSLRVRAADMRQQSAILTQQIASWEPKEPVTVTVETKVPLMHARGGYYSKTGKRCAASAMAAQAYARTTTTRADVTCPKCLKALAALDAKGGR
jgi:hypothetical protein